MPSTSLEMHLNRFRPGLCPGPHWGSLQRSLRPLAGGEGARRVLPMNPTPYSALRASAIQAMLCRPRTAPKINPSYGLGVVCCRLRGVVTVVVRGRRFVRRRRCRLSAPTSPRRVRRVVPPARRRRRSAVTHRRTDARQRLRNDSLRGQETRHVRHARLAPDSRQLVSK